MAWASFAMSISLNEESFCGGTVELARPPFAALLNDSEQSRDINPAHMAIAPGENDSACMHSSKHKNTVGMESFCTKKSLHETAIVGHSYSSADPRPDCKTDWRDGPCCYLLTTRLERALCPSSDREAKEKGEEKGGNTEKES